LAFGVWRLAFGVWRLAFGVGSWELGVEPLAGQGDGQGNRIQAYWDLQVGIQIVRFGKGGIANVRDILSRFSDLIP
jgi:hypothetical protein